MYYLIATDPANTPKPIDPAQAPIDNSQKQKDLEDLNRKDYNKNKNDPAKNNENELSIRDDSFGEILIDSFLLISIFATIAFLIYRISGMPRPKVITVNNEDDEDDNTIIIRKRPRKRRIIIRNDEPRPKRRIIIRN